MATARKRTRAAAAGGTAVDVSRSNKKSKLVKWEWLGDSGKWAGYSDDVAEKLTDSFVAGADETTVSVATGVKMKIRFSAMSQTNVATGWSRDIRCVTDDSSQLSVWEWEEGGAWKRYPDNVSRLLEATQNCDRTEVGVSLGRKHFRVNLTDEEMENKSDSTKSKIRRINQDCVWQWKNDGNVWTDYSPSDSQTIENAFSSANHTVAMTILGRSYKLDLTKMEQTNTVTMVTREIRRVPPPSSTSNPSGPSPVIPSKAKKAPPTGPEHAGASKVETEEEKEGDEEEVKSKPKSLKSQVFTGQVPVDSECTQKLGKAQVYSEGKETWNCMLNQTNLKNNNNKFYLLQLLKDTGKPSYSVWFRWGRVGKTGQHSFAAYGSDLESAKDCFRKKFHDKTQNIWEDRQSFVKVPGKYDLLEMDYEPDEEETDAPLEDETLPAKPKPVSKLDKRVQDLINLICDVQSMEEVIKEMKYDIKKAPLGKLTKAQIKSGYTALKKIESLVEAGKTTGDPLYRACDEFYTRVPHDFGMRRPPLIITREDIKEKIELLEALSDIQIAMSVIQKSSDVDIHPIDRHYNELNCTLNPLSSDDEMFGLIRKFVQQTHGKTHNNYTLDIKQVFEIQKEEEERKFKDVGNRQLLWHGSRLTNWVGILSQGLRIAPPEAPVTGYMFGKGLYFADVCSKSANYCFATPTRNEGLILLSEVSLGKENELLSADYNAHRLPKGTHSVKGVGRMVPDPTHNHTLPDGCVMPMGRPVDTGLVNTSGYTLNYNEFIVYDTSQVKMKYLILLKFKFK